MQHVGFFEDWRNFGNPHKIGKFLKLGVALILHYLLTHLLVIQTTRNNPQSKLRVLLLRKSHKKR